MYCVRPWIDSVVNMDSSLERMLRMPTGRPLVSATSLASITASAVGRKGRHLTGTFCLTGDTMEGIIQCLVFLKAFSVSIVAGCVLVLPHGGDANDKFCKVYCL